MKQYQAIARSEVLAVLYKLDATEGKSRFPWAAQDRIARMVAKTRQRPNMRRVGNILRQMEHEGVVLSFKYRKATWWRIKKRG